MSPLDFARKEVGVTESGGQNRGTPFTRYAINGEQPLAWCARFVRWCFENAKIKLPGNRYAIASVAILLKELRDQGGIVLQGSPTPGDLVILKTRDGSDAGRGMHIGIVETVDDVYVTSIDGNWGDKVQRVKRKRSDPLIAAYGRWPISPVA